MKIVAIPFFFLRCAALFFSVLMLATCFSPLLAADKVVFPPLKAASVRIESIVLVGYDEYALPPGSEGQPVSGFTAGVRVFDGPIDRGVFWSTDVVQPVFQTESGFNRHG